MKKRLTRDKLKEWGIAYVFIIPALALWIWWWAIPTIQSFSLSFYTYNYTRPDENVFVGLQNYIEIFSDEYFFRALKNSLLVVLVSVPLQSVFAMLLALAVNIKVRGRGIFRTIYYMPYILSGIATATVFQYMFVQDKFVPKLFSLIGFENTTWSANTKYALLLVILMYVWQQAGFYMIILLAGLEDIPKELHEAAMVDGASKVQSFFRVTLPLLRPIMMLVIIFGVINAFQIFDQIAALAKKGNLGTPAGSTSTIVTYLYTHSFKYNEVGYGSAVAVLLFVIIFVFTIVQQIITRRTGGEEAA